MKFEQELIFEAYNNVVLNEGGAAGHMMHPFDLPSVNNMNDLVNAFYDADNKLKTGNSSIKLDGVNLSLKVVNKNDVKQFALDRGSQKEIDVNGVTITDLSTRFVPKNGQQHGMVQKGKTILKIMNQSLPYIIDELKDLDMYDNPTKFLNTEFIEGTENVINYGDAKLLAFHGVNQFYEKIDRKGNITRPGLKPNLIKDNKGNLKKEKTVSRKINYDLEALESLREKVKPFAEKYGFDVVTNIYATKKGDPNFINVLNNLFSISFSNNETINQPLKKWIHDFHQIPKINRVATKDGRSIGAVSKENYQNILNSNNIPLNRLYDEQDLDTAIKGALTYHITRVLGNELLKNYTTDKYGDANEHEGIVITHVDYGKDMEGNPNSIKITGDFILSGIGGKLSTNKSKIPEEEDQSAPAVNYGNGKSDFSSYISDPRSSKSPGGNGFTRR